MLSAVDLKKTSQHINAYSVTNTLNNIHYITFLFFFFDDNFHTFRLCDYTFFFLHILALEAARLMLDPLYTFAMNEDSILQSLASSWKMHNEPIQWYRKPRLWIVATIFSPVILIPYGNSVRPRKICVQYKVRIGIASKIEALAFLESFAMSLHLCGARNVVLVKHIPAVYT